MAQRSVTAIGSGGQIGELGRESKYNRGFFMTSGDAMDFSRSARDPRRHYIGIGSVIVLHLLIVWALVSGLARKVIEVVKGPIEVKVIEEVAKPPPPPPEVPAPAAPPAPAIRQASVVCPNYREVMGSITYPREALLENLEGEVVIEFTVAANGQIRDPVIRSSTNRIFNRPSLSVVQSRLQCQGQGQDVRVQAPIVFKIR